jgi:hypothetical protein
VTELTRESSILTSSPSRLVTALYLSAVVIEDERTGDHAGMHLISKLEQDGSVASFRIETSELLTFWTGLERELHSKSLFRGPTEIRIRIGHGTPGRKLEPLVTLGVDKRSTFFAPVIHFSQRGFWPREEDSQRRVGTTICVSKIFCSYVLKLQVSSVDPW